MAQMVQVPFGNTRVNRVMPAMPVQNYTTYGMSRPLATHWRPATCEEAGCAAYRHGWVTTVDLSTDLGQRQYHYVTHDRTRRFTEQRVTATLVKLLFGPGQPCFRASEHRVPLERPARFIVAHGDWRGYLGTPRVHVRAEDWIEDFSEHLDRLATAIEKG